MQIWFVYGWQEKLCDPLATGPLAGRFRDGVRDEALYKPTFFTFYFIVLYDVTVCDSL